MSEVCREDPTSIRIRRRQGLRQLLKRHIRWQRSPMRFRTVTSLLPGLEFQNGRQSENPESIVQDNWTIPSEHALVRSRYGKEHFLTQRNSSRHSGMKHVMPRSAT